MDDAKFTSIHKKFHFHTTILLWLKFLVDGSEFLVDGSAWNLVKITAETLLSSVFCIRGGVMDDAKFTSIHKKFHFHTTILPWLKFLVDGSGFLVDGSAWNLVKITTKHLLSSVFCMWGGDG